MIIVVAGSRLVGRMPLLYVCRTIQSIMDDSHQRPIVRMRSGINTAPGELERLVEQTSRYMRFAVEWRIPNTWAHPGRKAVWYRDTDMLEDADLCMCFYTQADVDNGDESGTLALVEKAVGLDVPVYGFVVDFSPEEEKVVVERAGEHDREDRWGKIVAGILP